MLKLNSPKIELSVIIVSWNVRDLLANCLRSIVEQASDVDGLEVIVVDNASVDETLDLLVREFSWVQVIANKENRGFAVANNQAIRQSIGKYVLLLNPDTVVKPDCFRLLIDCMERESQVGLVGPRIIFPNGDIQLPCARRLPTLLSELLLVAMGGGQLPLMGSYIQRKLAYPYDYQTAQPVEAVLGASMLVRRLALADVGALDEDFYYCGEDIEWCARMRRAGWQVQYLPQAEVIHYAGQSSKQTNVAAAINATLSIHGYYLKVFGRKSAYIYKLIMRLVGVPKLLLVACLYWAIFRISTSEFRERIRIASGIWQWRLVGQSVHPDGSNVRAKEVRA